MELTEERDDFGSEGRSEEGCSRDGRLRAFWLGGGVGFFPGRALLGGFASTAEARAAGAFEGAAFSLVDRFLAGGAALAPGAFLTGAFLTGAFLTGAFLAGAFLAGAFLAGAFLAGAFLAGAFLAGAFLAGAFFLAAVVFLRAAFFLEGVFFFAAGLLLGALRVFAAFLAAEDFFFGLAAARARADFFVEVFFFTDFLPVFFFEALLVALRDAFLPAFRLAGRARVGFFVALARPDLLVATDFPSSPPGRRPVNGHGLGSR